MFGQGRFHAGILLDLYPKYSFDSTNERYLDAFRAEIW